MNKLTKGLLTVSLATALVFPVAACGCNGNGGSSWKGTDFTDYGAVVSSTLGGLSAETENYVYFINGIESNSADNTFGTPVKGSLVAADKKDLSKSQVVIPELMTSSDYGAGVYIFGSGEETYAYYGTPNREKNSSGQVASSEMTFTKTRLDGKKSEKLFTVSSHSINYRVAADGDGNAYIVYYDTENKEIVSYNCNAKKSTVIAKTDEKTNEKTGDEYLSLGDYKFLNNGNGAQIVYTMTVYTQEYYSAQEEQTDSYTRETASYNYMYLYQAGKDPVCIKNGKTSNEKYTIKSNADGYLFYTATPLGGTEKTYGAKISDLIADASAATHTELYYSANVKDDMIVRSYEEVYYLDTDAHKVIKTTLVKTDTVDEFNTRETILIDETLNSLIKVDAKYVYGFNTDGYIIAVELSGEGRTIRVSERTASASWYKPETVTLNVNGTDTEYMLYCDSSTEGNSYVYYSDLNKLVDPKTEDTDDDDEIDLYYLESSFIGVMPAADRAKVVSAKIAAIEEKLDLKTEDGKYTADSVKKARAAYDALSDEAKNSVSSDDLKKLTNAEKALALADAFIKLEPVIDYANLSEEKKNALKADYETAKTLVESYGDDYTTISEFLSDNMNYFYQQTAKKISENA